MRVSDKLYDVSAYAEALPSGTKEAEQLKAAVKNARGAQAEVNDLRRAEQMMRMLDALDLGGVGRAKALVFEQDEEDGIVGQALYVAAIVIYVRATERRSNHKPKPEYESAFSAQQLEDHQFILRLRDDALAHWGPGPDRHGQKHHSIAVVADGETIGTRWSGANYRGEIAKIIHDLSTTCLSVSEAKLQDATALVVKRLDAQVEKVGAITLPELDQKAFFEGDIEIVADAPAKTTRRPSRPA